jgi:hypothetical protein
MSGHRWIVMTIATILAVAAANFAVAYAVDPYGMWRDPAGRQLPIAVIANGRKAKFLLSEHYVPANFGGLMVGPSVLANWDISTIAGTRIYNLSLDGANAAEEKLVLDQALHQGHYKLAIFALNPTNTSSHWIKGGLDQTTSAEAIASFHLYIQEVAYALRALHHGAGYVDIAPNGRYNRRLRKSLELEVENPTRFQIDPTALYQFREMISALQRQGAFIVYVVPPIYEPSYLLNKRYLQAYTATIVSLVPKAPVIDFNDPKYTALCSDPNNFADFEHTAPAGTAKFSVLLAGLVSQAITTEN